jgi:hypothetical protein
MGKAATFVRHAFGFRTVGPIFVTGVSGWTALADRNMSIDDPEFWVLAIGGIGCGLLSWAVIAYDSFSKHKENNELLRAMEGMRTSVNALTQTTPVNLQNLAAKSNAQIKDLVVRSVAELRMFDAKVTTDRYESIYSSDNLVWPHVPEEVKNALWDKRNKEMMEKSQNQQNEFRANIKPLASALRLEMKKRLPNLPPPPDISVALEHGMLAGPHPAADAADELEMYARELPDD